MGAIYTHRDKSASFSVHESAPIAYCQFQPSSGRIVRIHGWSVCLADRANGVMESTSTLTVRRGTGATSGGGATVVSSVLEAIQKGDATPTSTVKGGSDTLMSPGSGSVETLEQVGWQFRYPLCRIYLPRLRPVVSPSQMWEISVEANSLVPAYFFNSVVMTVFFEEIG